MRINDYVHRLRFYNFLTHQKTDALQGFCGSGLVSMEARTASVLFGGVILSREHMLPS